MLSNERIREYEEKVRINPIIEYASIGAKSEEIKEEIECYRNPIKQLLR